MLQDDASSLFHKDIDASLFDFALFINASMRPDFTSTHCLLFLSCASL